MPKKPGKQYNRPKKIYDLALIKSETDLINRYGLKNRREVWRADFAIGKIRRLAKELITASDEEKEKFLDIQRAKGFEVNSIADVLALNKEDLLKRRLQSIIVKKKLAQTHKQARQLIAHKHVTIKGHKINSPSHLTTLEEEATVELNIKIPEKKVITDEEKKILEKMNHKSEENTEEATE